MANKEPTGTRDDTVKHPTLAMALLAAQMQITSVGKDATHSAGTKYAYDYTSADGMVAACRDALHSNGVVARRKSWTATPLERSIKVEYMNNGGSAVAETEEIPIFEVKSTLLLTLAHSGETEEIVLPWVAIPGKGRPPDKAIAGALTTCNSYWLLGLLQVPRVDENEMNQRDDGPQRGHRDSPRQEARKNAEQQRGPAKGPDKEGQAAPSSRQVPDKKPDVPVAGRTLAQAKLELVNKVRDWISLAEGERPQSNRVYTTCTQVLMGLKVIAHPKEVSEDVTAFNSACLWVQARIEANDPLSVLDPPKGERTVQAEQTA